MVHTRHTLHLAIHTRGRIRALEYHVHILCNARVMQASAAQDRSYLWHVPGIPVSVDLSLRIVNRIAAVVTEGLETEGRGIEAGGLLLGRTQRHGGQTIVVIEDFEPLQCEHLAGASFILSASDRRALEARIRRRKAAGGSSLAGFYRSNTRQGYGATIEDVALMSAYFSDSSNVFLLI